ncbi:B12-binding domain-containing radical SAM protein [bacterium]|nr:B12-binding domain-containing radical SAM protein [bacterium]
MKICLIRPSKSKYDDIYTRTSVFYPMGLGYIASSLEREKFEVKIIDAFLENIDVHEVVTRVIEFDPDVVGISFSTENRFSAIRTAKELKKSRSSFFIIGGGPHPTLAAEDLLKNISSFDLVVRGEGESSFTRLCKKIKEGAQFTNLAGISYRHEGGFIHNKGEKLIQDLNRIPFPARHLFPRIKLDDKTFTESFETFSAETIITSRGCPIGCNFCATTKLWGQTFRSRSPANIVKEIEHVIKKYETRRFWFFDDVFTLNKMRVKKFCYLLIDNHINIEWVTQTRINSLDADLLKLMKRVGCKQVLCGIESGSNKILGSIVKKKLTTYEVLSAANQLALTGLEARGTFIFSHPEEELEDGEKTLELMKNILPAIKSRAGIMKIYPGTEIEKIAMSKKLLPEDFTWTMHYKNIVPQFKIFSGEVPLFLDKLSFWQIANLLAAYSTIQNIKPSLRMFEIFKKIDSWMEFKYLFLLSLAKTLHNLHFLKWKRI